MNDTLDCDPLSKQIVVLLQYRVIGLSGIAMHSDGEYERIAIIVILSGCGIAVAFAFAVLICCQFLVKPKYSRYKYKQNSHVVVFERQTTTSDENNCEYFSNCYEDSITMTQQPQCDSDTNGDTVSSPNTVIAITDQLPSNNVQPTQSQPQQRSTSPQVKFATRTLKSRKASLPCKFTIYQQKEDKKNSKNELTQQQRRSSAGIIRQKSFDDIDEDVFHAQNISNNKTKTTATEETVAIDKLRKEYRDLWQLRATFEAEEMEMSNESSDSLPSNPQRIIDQKLTKNDSGYKSIERRDYSIDYKTEYIFRQFTTTTPQRLSHRQQSIQEEQESETQATFV